MRLADLRSLCAIYVPRRSRHSNSFARNAETWWYAHELGHLLVAEPISIGMPYFGLDWDQAEYAGRHGRSDLEAQRLYHPSMHQRRCIELAAMSISARLLMAVGRPDLAIQEWEDTDKETLYYPGKAAATKILAKNRCLTLPHDLVRLEAKIIGKVEAVSPTR